MIKDIEKGLINCVITKDLSRLGRNYLDCGLYLEVFFPENNVRYIAVNDGVDTLNKSAMDITPFRNILNEMYSADVSVKIKSAYRARFQQGKFMGTTAPYGYVKDPADHNHLLIDDKVAHVVREIFDLALAGNGIAKIRKHINKQHILRPAAYAVEQGATGYERYFEDNEENRYIWSENSVRGILRSPIYAGNLAGYKRIAANMKSKKRPSKLPEEWEVIPDTHEGIVTQEEFDTVQQLMTSRRREQNAGGFENIFSGVIKCADCGYAMRAASANRRKRPDIIDCVEYTCNNYGIYGNVTCTAHSIEARDLFNAVLADINRFADMAVNDEKAVRAIERRLTETDQSRAKSLEKEKKKLNKRLAELDRLFSSLYEDKVMERITERNFEMMSGKYQKEQLEIEARLKEVTETLNDSYEKSQGVRDFLSLIRNYQGLKELDATIINALIDKILVSEREKLADGTVRQEIKIYYKFIGFVGELHITPTKRWTALKPKNCTVCGVEYVPSSGISKYCPACAKRIQREKSNESKRRSRERNRRACIELSAKNDRLMPSSTAKGLLGGKLAKTSADLMGYEKNSQGRSGLFVAAWSGFGLLAPMFLSASFLSYSMIGCLPEEYGQVSWMQWLIAMVPWGIIVFAGMWLTAAVLYRPDGEKSFSKDHICGLYRDLGKMQTPEKLTGLILAVCLVFWILERTTGISAGIVSLVGGMLCFVLGILKKEELADCVPWGFVLFVGVVLNLGDVLTKTGISGWILQMLGPVLLTLESKIVLICVVVAVTVLLRFVLASQTAVITLLVGVLAPIAMELQMNPFIIGLVVYANVAVWVAFYQNPTYLASLQGMEGTIEHQNTVKAGILYILISAAACLISVPYWGMLGYM